MRRNRELALFEDDFEMRRHTDVTLRLQQISTTLIREGSNGAIYDHVLDAAIELMFADMGSMQVFHPERGELRLLAERGFHPQSAAYWEWVRLDSGSACGMALSAGCRVIVSDIETCDAMVGTGDLDAYRWSDIRAVQSTPLLSRSGQLLGMISTHWRRPHRPTERELQPLDVLARQAADLIERNEVEKALRESREQLQRQADLLDQSHDAIFTWKIGGGINYWSRGAEVMYGYTSEEAIGRSPHELLRTNSPIPMVEVEVQTAREGSWYGELTHITREGRVITVESRHVRVSYGGEAYTLETNRDITARKQAEEALRKSEERFRSSLLHSPLPVALFDDQEQVLGLSQSWLEQTGYSREELRCIKDWTDRAYGERSGEVREYIREVMPTEADAHSRERIIRTKDGRERLWNFVTSSLGTRSDGRRLFICVAQDVTERKAHEEQVQLLMREVNHRAKNMLSLVLAIARQTSAREPEHFIGRFTERVHALAANQDLLIRNDWKGVDAGDLVNAQLAHFSDLIGSRIIVHGPKLRLNAVAAQAIGLALHELATNAGKYGALSTDRGRVDVCWDTNSDTLTMSWTERGGPPVTPPKRRGFGSTVVASLAKTTVGGGVQLEFAPSGLVWRLTCPVANVLEQGHLPN
jgi:PAS domain S-box-containing protein